MAKFIYTAAVSVIILTMFNCYADIVEKENTASEIVALENWRDCLIAEVNKDHFNIRCRGDCSEKIRNERIANISKYTYNEFEHEILDFIRNGNC